jgi:hypothetical protein
MPNGEWLLSGAEIGRQNFCFGSRAGIPIALLFGGNVALS